MTKTIRQEDTIKLDEPIAQDVLDFVASQNISLKPNELARIRELFGRNPTLVELHIFNIMWSEHCSYKSSRDVLKTLPTEAPHVVLGPGEDAGVIRFYEKDGKSHCLVLAHESHNHPSQVLPVEGAATGIGGIVRDVYCMGADVVGVLDPLRFGDPDGPNRRRVRDIVRGVVDGIAQYGNALGVPNWGGEAYFDASFDDNCLVNVVAIGTVEESEMIRSRAPEQAQKETYDIILIGKPTDASGFGGAAFASEILTGEEERQEAVQVPDPFLKRVLAEATKVVLREAIDNKIPIGFKDLGAGGIACAVSEMAQAGGVGGHLDLNKVNKQSDALLPEVVSCSETQERFAMFVPRSFTERVLRIYNEDFDMPHIYTGAGAFVIGETSDDQHFKLTHNGVVVCDAHVDVITEGIKYDRELKPRDIKVPNIPDAPDIDTKETLLSMLSSYNVCDKSILFQHYDCEVQGRAVLRPGQADAAVALYDPNDKVGIATSIGGNSRLGAVDPYLGGVWAVVEACRNVACVGGLPLAVTDCLNFGSPEDPEVFWEFSEAVRGIGDACRGLQLYPDGDYGVPVVSGNVSFYNQSGQGAPIAPTPIVSCAGRVDDVSVCRDSGFKREGSVLALLGELHEKMGGSEFARMHDLTGAPPRPDLGTEAAHVRTLIEACRHNLIFAAHDITHGGMLVALSEMILASAPNPVGCRIELDDATTLSLFSEYGGIIIEVDEALWPEVEVVLEQQDVPYRELGETTDDGNLTLEAGNHSMTVSFDELKAAYHTNSRVNPIFARGR